MNIKGKFLIGALLILFASVVIWAVRTVPEPPPLTVKSEEPKVMTYDNNTISEEQAGVKIWDLTSESMTVNTTTQDAEMTGITGHFYSHDGRTVTLTAEHGYYTHETRDIKIDGKVKVSTNDGITLTADELMWLAKEAKLAAQGNAVVTKDDIKATADRIESTDGFSMIKAIGHAHFEKGVEENGEKKNV